MFEYLLGPVIKLTIFSFVLSAILVYTPLGYLSHKLGVWDAIFKGIEAIIPEKDISLEEFANKLTGQRSMLYDYLPPEQKKRQQQNNRKER